MVISRNLSAYNDVPPTDGEGRKISSGPLYELAKIKALATAKQGVLLVTKKCQDNATRLGLEPADVGQLIGKLSASDYRDSEWCEMGKAWLGCDAYVLTQTEYNEVARKDYQYEYFLKFAIGKNGLVVMVISCHLSN